MLSYAEEYGRHPAFLIWFDLRFADFMGHRLQLEEQEAGNRRQAARNRGQAYRFAADHGGLVEPGYASKHRIPATPLAPEAVALLKAWQQAESPEEVLNTSFNPAYLAQIERVLGKFAEHHYDLPPHVRQTASATLRAA